MFASMPYEVKQTEFPDDEKIFVGYGLKQRFIGS